jgi:hypothetical protein
VTARMTKISILSPRRWGLVSSSGVPVTGDTVAGARLTGGARAVR